MIDVLLSLKQILLITMHGKRDSDQHLMTLFSMALQTKAKRILELGVREGHTTMPFLLATVLNNGKLTSVDIGPTSFVVPPEIANHHEFIMMDSIKFLENCVATNTKYDLIFIDDWHTYEHVKKELELISKISDYNTVILLHDLMGFNHQPNYWCPDKDHHKGGEWEGGGPFKAVCELDINEFEWATIPVNHGLTLLRKRSSFISD